MPEVIEVKKYSNFLLKNMKNKKLLQINILNGRYKKHGSFPLYDKLVKSLPLKIVDVKSKGKFMYILFENNLILFVTLGLTGGWVSKKNNNFINYEAQLSNFTFPLESEYVGQNKNIERYKKNALNHLNVEFILDSEIIIYFYDMLSFGTLKVVDNEQELTKKLKSLSLDIMDSLTTYLLFKGQIMKKPNKEIGNVLVDQKIISGIGNYLRSDILWLSKISPFRLVKDLTDKELKEIFKNTKILVLEQKGFKKLPSNYGRNFFIYKESTDIYGNPVIKELLYEGSQKRYIYWVKNIQK